MKILTITCHDVYNFGASLQAYALQHYLEELGHDVRIINYRPEYLYKKYDWKAYTSKKYDRLDKFFLTRWMFRIAKWSYLRFSIGRKKCFDDFSKNNLKLTKDVYFSFDDLKRNPPYADIIIAGSDQIWNPLFQNGRDRSFYIDFALIKTRRVSYAASFSVNNIPDSSREFMRLMLSKMNQISVREFQGIDILKTLGIKGAKKVLDPVFLLDRCYWETFMHKRSETGYILIYDFEGSDLMKRVALSFKKEKGLKIYSINDALPRLYADKNFTNVGPKDFLSLIYNCSVFLSNSFHGTAFSIYFNKPFYVFGLNGVDLNSRMDSLLSTVDLKDRLITEDIDLNTLHFDYDFNKVNSLIDKEKRVSKQFLDSVLRMA